MGKYLLLWQLDVTRVPVDVNERSAAWLMMLEAVKKDLADGIHSDWGTFVGEMKGYTITSDDEVKMINRMQQFFPYLHFEAHPVMTVEQMIEVAKSLAQ